MIHFKFAGYEGHLVPTNYADPTHSGTAIVWLDDDNLSG